ncbi:protein of unknown function [Hyphomicrobium sp. MC1]|nr:protein of unknown function [Hyphomicrobium sp. MC1]
MDLEKVAERDAVCICVRLERGEVVYWIIYRLRLSRWSATLACDNSQFSIVYGYLERESTRVR